MDDLTCPRCGEPHDGSVRRCPDCGAMLPKQPGTPVGTAPKAGAGTPPPGPRPEPMPGPPPGPAAGTATPATAPEPWGRAASASGAAATAGAAGDDPFADFDPSVQPTPRITSPPMMAATGAAGSTVGAPGQLALRLPDGQAFPLTGQPVHLNRNPDASPIAAWCGNNISRHHAQIRPGRNGVLVVVDEGSTNGTFVNGRQLAPGLEHPLSPGDEVQLATDPPLRFRVDTGVIT